MSGLYAVANAIISHGRKFGEPVMHGWTFANPGRIQEIIEMARRNNLQTS
jgi:hypothetical protein